MKEQWNQWSRYQKILLTMMLAMTVAFGILTLVNRFRPGIQFRDSFLTMEQSFGLVTYSGRCDGRQTNIRVYAENGVHVDMTAGDWERNYTVVPWDGFFPPIGSTFFHLEGVEGILVTEGEQEIFRGGYMSGNGWLVGEDGELSSEGFGFYFSAGYESEEQRWAEYDPAVGTIVRMAREPEIVCRGSIGLYLLVLLLTVIIAVDVAFPLFFFQLRHMFSVQNPEPTEFYLAMQKLEWGVMQVVLLVAYWQVATVLP